MNVLFIIISVLYGFQFSCVAGTVFYAFACDKIKSKRTFWLLMVNFIPGVIYVRFIIDTSIWYNNLDD